MLAESAKKREEFLKKEKSILEEIYYLQTKCAMTPIGRDRFYRRYWIFNSMPGVFVEDEDYDFKISAARSSDELLGDKEPKAEIKSETSPEFEDKPVCYTFVF